MYEWHDIPCLSLNLLYPSSNSNITKLIHITLFNLIFNMPMYPCKMRHTLTQTWCVALHLIMHYLMIANYFWMFCEGLHLHLVLVVVCTHTWPMFINEAWRAIYAVYSKYVCVCSVAIIGFYQGCRGHEDIYASRVGCAHRLGDSLCSGAMVLHGGRSAVSEAYIHIK